MNAPENIHSIHRIQDAMLENGLVIGRTIQLGLAAVWSGCVQPALDDALDDQFADVCEALDCPADVQDSLDLIMHLQSQGKYGWLIEAERLYKPTNGTIREISRPRWFYHDDFFGAVQLAIAWAEDGAK